MLSNLGRFVIPLLFIPLASRGLNTDDFTALTITISFSTWAALIVEFGFNYSAGNKIRYTSKPKNVYFVGWNVLIAKLGLSLTSILIGVYCSWLLFHKIDVFYLCLFWVYSFSVGGINSFIFVATKRSSMLMYGEAFGVLLFALLILIIYLFDLNTYLYAFFSSLILYRLTVFIFFTICSGVFKSHSKNVLYGVLELRKSIWYGFYQISSSLYLYGLSVISSFLVDKNIIVYHVLAERIYRIFSFSFTPLSRLIFTKINNVKTQFEKNRVQTLGMVISIIYGGGLTVLLMFIAPFVIKIIYGENYILASNNLSVLGVSYPVAFCNGILSATLFLATKKMRYLNFTIVFAGISCLPICYGLSKIYPQLAPSLTYLAVECLILILFLVYYFKIQKTERNESN